MNDDETLWVNSLVTQTCRPMEQGVTFKRSLLLTMYNPEGFLTIMWIAWDGSDGIQKPRIGYVDDASFPMRYCDHFLRPKCMSPDFSASYLSDLLAHIKGIRGHAAQFSFWCAKIARFFCEDQGIREHTAQFLVSESLDG